MVEGGYEPTSDHVTTKQDMHEQWNDKSWAHAETHLLTRADSQCSVSAHEAATTALSPHSIVTSYLKTATFILEKFNPFIDEKKSFCVVFILKEAT